MTTSVELTAALVLLVMVITLAVMASGMKIIQPYERGIYTRLGRFVRVLPPGLNIVTPLVGQVSRIDMRPQEVETPIRDTITLDRQRMNVTLRYEYVVVDPFKTFSSTANCRDELARKSTVEAMTALSAMRKEDIPGQINRISERVEGNLRELGLRMGVEVRGVRITLEPDS